VAAIESQTTKEALYREISALYRKRFDDAPPIYLITLGGVVNGGRMSEDAAWELCRDAAESGKPLEFYAIAEGTDLA
jgi:hypothetical protein